MQKTLVKKNFASRWFRVQVRLQDSACRLIFRNHSINFLRYISPRLNGLLVSFLRSILSLINCAVNIWGIENSSSSKYSKCTKWETIYEDACCKHLYSYNRIRKRQWVMSKENKPRLDFRYFFFTTLERLTNLFSKLNNRLFIFYSSHDHKKLNNFHSWSVRINKFNFNTAFPPDYVVFRPFSC